MKQPALFYSTCIVYRLPCVLPLHTVQLKLHAYRAKCSLSLGTIQFQKPASTHKINCYFLMFDVAAKIAANTKVLSPSLFSCPVVLLLVAMQATYGHSTLDHISLHYSGLTLSARTLQQCFCAIKIYSQCVQCVCLAM